MPKRKEVPPDSDSDEESLADSETDSDASEIDPDLEVEESDGGESQQDFLKPSKSYHRISDEYNCTQTKLEKDYEFSWVPGEKEYHENLCNENLLTEKDKKMILSLSYVKLFELFFNTKLKNLIIDSTNENGYPLTLEDLNRVIGFAVFTSFNTRSSQKDFWSRNPFLRAEPVAQAMSRNHYLKTKSALKYAPSRDKNDEDKIWRVRRMVEIFNENIMQFGIFTTALSIDEMMVKFYGRLVIKQFIKAKPIKFGIKEWGICSANGYLFHFEIYCGKNSEKEVKLSKIAQGSRVVMRMLDQLLRKTASHKIGQYHVYFDNLFTCPDLLIHLKKLGLKSTGVVRNDRIQVENVFEKNAPRGTYAVQHEKNSGMNFISVQDSKKVSIISTAAGVTPLTTVQRYVKGEGRKDLQFPNAHREYPLLP